MAQEDAGRPLHSSGTDGWHSSAPASRSTQSHASPSRERRATNSTYKNGDGAEFPRYFHQIGQDVKRTRGYDMIQELQLMVCSKETGIKGNAARARVMVLLREVQGVLMGLENKVDAQTYDLGVFNVERTELRKELRDQKAKEFQPLHTIDFRSTEVKDLPHKLRTLFEDNQILREQVRQLQYSVRSAEARLEASERRAAALETENLELGIGLREAGSSVDIAHDMRQMREAVRNAEARAMQLEMQLMATNEQLESERRLALQRARHAAAKHAMLESRLTQALSVGTSGSGMGGRLGGGGGAAAVHKSGTRSGVYDVMGMDDGGSFSGRGGDTVGGTGGGSVYGASSVLDGGAGGAGGATTAAFDGRSSAHSRVHSTASAGVAGRTSAGRERSLSPPRSPSGRSISHSPGSGIPTLYPLFNAKPRPTHAFSADSGSWLTGTSPGRGSSSGAAGGSASGNGTMSSSGLPPPPSLVRNSSLTDRPAGHGGSTARPSSGILPHGSAGGTAQVGTMEVLQEGRPTSSTSTSTSSPGELVRAINSSAVVTSRALLPSVSGASAGRPGAPGILGLRVGAFAGNGTGSSIVRRSTGSDDFQLGPAAAARRSASGASASPASGAGDDAAGPEPAGRTGNGNPIGCEEPGRSAAGGANGSITREAVGTLEGERWVEEETAL